ncbi:MAG: hypothetical protein K9L70_03580 [Thiohalocapsa sp.]|nr:hypothetical protein [Thiohalocapsa sp.]
MLNFLRNVRRRRRKEAGGSDAASGSGSGADPHADGDDTDRGLRLRDYFTLRPYGRRLITPAVSVWLWSAWIVIMLMASIEGFVWAAVGSSIVPEASRWLALPVAAFMFLLMFSIVWIVDSSLIMSERPSLRGSDARGASGIGPVLRWTLGIVARVGIVAVSLYVTAPFIEKLIRADDIAGYHEAQVEQYFKQRDATIREQVQARAAQIDAGLAAGIASLEQEIERLSETLQGEQERRARIEAEYRPEIEVLTRDLAAARARVGDEVLGREGRPEGYGPEARKWDERANLLQATLAEIQAERDARLADVEAAIDEQQQRLEQRSDALQETRSEQRRLIERLTDEVIAQHPPASPPRLTFAARSKALSALRESPGEVGVPHFETVEGFAQAALGILFFALIALKLFEPSSVHAYYSETTQLQYAKYLAGGLGHIPGFDDHDEPHKRLSPVEFARLWELYERDPDAYFEQIKTVVSAEARVQRLLSDRDYELELLQRQRRDIDERLVLERKHREAELDARRRELDLQLEEKRKRLDGETRLEVGRLEQQRAEAKRAHDLALQRLEHEYAAERERLDTELARKSEAWEQQRAVEEEELRQRRSAYEDARRSAREETRLRQMALDDQRRLRELELRQTGDEMTRRQDRESRRLRIDKTRELLAEEQAQQATQHAALGDLRMRIAERTGKINQVEHDLRQLDERLREKKERMEVLQSRIDEAAEVAPRALRLFGSDSPAAITRRNAERKLKVLERDHKELAGRRDLRHTELLALQAEHDALRQSHDALASEAAMVDRRVAQHRERLDTLLLARG